MNEVFLGKLVELPAPHDIVGSVEDFVDLFFAEALHGGVVVGDVESYNEF